MQTFLSASLRWRLSSRIILAISSSFFLEDLIISLWTERNYIELCLITLRPGVYVAKFWSQLRRPLFSPSHTLRKLLSNSGSSFVSLILDHSYLSQPHLLVISVTNSPADMLSPRQMKDETLLTSVCITAPVLSVVSNVNVSHLCKTQDRSSPDSASDRNEQKTNFRLCCAWVSPTKTNYSRFH